MIPMQFFIQEAKVLCNVIILHVTAILNAALQHLNGDTINFENKGLNIVF